MSLASDGIVKNGIVVGGLITNGLVNKGNVAEGPTIAPALTILFDVIDGFSESDYFINLNLLNTGGKAESWEWVNTPPPWLTLSPSGYLSGTADIGSWTGYAVKATNIIGTSTSNTDSVAITLQIPVLSALFDLIDGADGDVYSLDLNTLNTGGLVASWAWNGAPPSWASLDTSTGLITGTATDGTWTGYSVTATNATGSDTSNTDSITIVPSIPDLTGVFDLIDGYVGDTFNLDLNTLNTGGSVASWSWSGTPPTWASLDTATGIITGTSTEGSWSGYAVVATNAVGSDTSNTDSTTILKVPTPPVFSGVFDILDGPEGSTINYDVSSLFSNSPTSYAFTGSYPTGLSINNAGLITGTLQDGTWTGYAVTATNIDGSDTSNTDSITVASLAPVFSGVFNISDGNVGDAISYDVSGLFSNTPTSYSTNGAFPTGLSIDNAGLITGTLVEGTWVGYSITATNSYGSDTSNTDSINVTISTGIPFVGAYRALTSVQGVDTAGDICNILPRGTIPATSLHNAPILAPDYQGVYQEYAVDDLIWKGGRIDAGETYATDEVGGDLQPYAQANKDATNVVIESEYVLAQAIVFTLNYDFGLSAAQTTSRLEDNTTSVATLKSNPININSCAGRIFLKKELTYSSTLNINVYLDGVSQGSVLINPVTGVHAVSSSISADLLYEVVEFRPNWWVILWELKSNNNISLSTWVYPAWNDNPNPVPDETYNASAVGSIEIDAQNIIEGHTIASIRNLPPIYSPTAITSIPKTQYTYPAANIPDPSNVVIGITLDYAGETNGNVLDIGGNLILYYGESQETVLGSELVNNGTFDSDTNGWAFSETGSVVWNTGGTVTIFDTVSHIALNQNITLELGKPYTLQGNSFNITNPAYFNTIQLRNGATLISISEGSSSVDFIADGQNLINCFCSNKGLGVDSYDIDNVSIKEILIAPALILSDGINTIEVPITVGKRVIEITLTATDMTLDVDGVTQTGAYTPVASGLITVEEDHWNFHAN